MHPLSFAADFQGISRALPGASRAQLWLEQTLRASGAEFLQLMLTGLCSPLMLHSQTSRKEKHHPPSSWHKLELGPFLRDQPRWHLHSTDLQGLGQSLGNIFVGQHHERVCGRTRGILQELSCAHPSRAHAQDDANTPEPRTAPDS